MLWRHDYKTDKTQGKVMKKQYPTVYPIVTRQTLPEGRIVTACLLLNDEGTPLAYGQTIKDPFDDDKKGFSYRTAIRKAAKALLTKRTPKYMSRWIEMPTYVNLEEQGIAFAFEAPHWFSHPAGNKLIDNLQDKTERFIDSLDEVRAGTSRKFKPLDWDMVFNVNESPGFQKKPKPPNKLEEELYQSLDALSKLLHEGLKG